MDGIDVDTVEEVIREQIIIRLNELSKLPSNSVSVALVAMLGANKPHEYRFPGDYR